MNIVHFAILGLAVWRISHMVMGEDGPWDIVAKFRHFLGVRYDENSEPYGTTMASKMALCVWCNSVWVGIGYGTLYMFLPIWAVGLAMPFALSTCAIFLERFAGGK